MRSPNACFVETSCQSRRGARTAPRLCARLGRLRAPGGRAFVPVPIGSSRGRRRRLARRASPASCAPSPRAGPRRAPGPASCAPGARPRLPPPGRRSYCLMAATPAVPRPGCAEARLHLLPPPPPPPGPVRAAEGGARARGGLRIPTQPASPGPAGRRGDLGHGAPPPRAPAAAPPGRRALAPAWASVSPSLKQGGPWPPSKRPALSWRYLDACQGHAL